MRNKLKTRVALGAFLLMATSLPAYAFFPIQHVLLISVDGMHAIDYLNCKKGGYCPALTALGTNGVNYLNTSTSKPSDSFPGLMSIMTGATPRTMGVNYDVAYDRALNPPKVTTGNGLPAGPCTPGKNPSGTTTEYDEGIDIMQSQLNAGAPAGTPESARSNRPGWSATSFAIPSIRGTSSATIPSME